MINTAKLFMVKYKFSESAFILSSILKKNPETEFKSKIISDLVASLLLAGKPEKAQELIAQIGQEKASLVSSNLEGTEEYSKTLKTSLKIHFTLTKLYLHKKNHSFAIYTLGKFVETLISDGHETIKESWPYLKELFGIVLRNFMFSLRGNCLEKNGSKLVSYFENLDKAIECPEIKKENQLLLQF